MVKGNPKDSTKAFETKKEICQSCRLQNQYSNFSCFADTLRMKLDPYLIHIQKSISNLYLDKFDPYQNGSKT